jgi:CRP-like cAMP-binding protein
MPAAELRNHLLLRMSPEDREAVLAIATPFEFLPGHVFNEAGERVNNLYFVERGIISSIAVMKDGRTTETYMVGFEGVTSAVASAAEVYSFSRLVAQVAGNAWRVDASQLRALMQERRTLLPLMADYAAAGRNQMEQSIACNALHRSDQRLAKWLLRCHDRIDDNTYAVTQEYLASMLGSQRTVVNETAQTLQRVGAITYSRGRVTITDRAALERAACECYRGGGIARVPDNLIRQ